MWENLSVEKRNEYKRMILAFASLTEAFAQKADECTILSPIINSKYQETLFQKVFDASAEDIGNTSYDVAINTPDIKYLVGIKTFGISAGDQKVAQFKANITEWSDIIRSITNNAKDKTEIEINTINHSLYLDLAKKISTLRNKRIDSSIANLQGFQITTNDTVESVYHVLMPSAKNTTPSISVGETSYDKINIENIIIEGCTSKNNPSNFIFSDGNHTYKYTSADSQLHMKFDNLSIVKEVWPVVYAKDAYAIFSDIAKKILDDEGTLTVRQPKITESHIWPIEVFPFSGFNAFFGIGSKLATADRSKKIETIKSKYIGLVDDSILTNVISILQDFLLCKCQ